MANEIAKINPELLSLLAKGADQALSPFKNEIFLQDITVAGTGYCDQINEVFPQLQENTVLRMQRDPENAHDELAVGVWFNSIRIGWVPQKLNPVVARLMDAGKNLFLRVGSTCVENDNWKRIECKMYMID